MKIFILSFFICAFASAADICSTAIDENNVQEHINFLLEKHFPELQNIKIKIENFESNAYFLQANLKKKTIFKEAHKRTYVIEVNQKLYACPPTPKGLRAILAHEIQHISDYLNMSSAEIIALAARYSTNKKFHTEYERSTDKKTLEKGFGKGLIDYRLWVYQWLSPKQLKEKKRFYYTPEEIETWMQQH
jgi:coenzyme F420-reducing hydrogenase gamma subunit